MRMSKFGVTTNTINTLLFILIIFLQIGWYEDNGLFSSYDSQKFGLMFNQKKT